MKLIKPNVEIIEQQPGLEGMYKQIELAGRTCYKSEDKITEDSTKAFVDRMIKSGHGAMLEHGTIYLSLGRCPIKPIELCETPEEELTAEQLTELREYLQHISAWNFYDKNKYSKVVVIGVSKFVTTNLRVLVENKRLADLKWFTKPTQFHEKRITVKWTCDRGVSHEFVRHRVFSFAMESTRYCNYSKDKFNNEITFVIPTWIDESEESLNSEFRDTDKDDVSVFIRALKNSEEEYFTLLNNGWKPQQARQVLPNALKTELVMTGFESDWKGFFKLRSPKYGATGVHPDAAYLADKLYDLLYIEKDYDFSLVHHDAFDGECSFLNDGDMITYHSTHDKNKDSYTIESVTITPKDGEVRTLSREEYLKLTNNTSNESHLSFKAELLDLNESKIKKSKKSSEECKGMYRIIDDNGNIYCVNSNNYEKEKEFRKEKEEEFGSKQTNTSR